ncbi:hypothetical protein RUND412_010554 [Rhizina undulata]
MANDRKVFAHYMLGLTSGQTSDEWASDMKAAKASLIDGFALNAGPTDSYGPEQLALAYQVAEQNDFSLFISFDMACCGDWPVQTVIDWINKYKDSKAQFKVDGKPFVSTFEGPKFADSWAQVKAGTGDIYLVPDWTSLGPSGFSQYLDKVDGAFSWDAWPTAAGQKTNESDVAWLNTVGAKSYMMGVSPWFYTDLPQYSKNWLWDSDTLWFDRWESVLDVLPNFVEIITWNDYGESHYIGPIRASGIVTGAETYVSNMPHEAWRNLLPYYITAYKSGSRDVKIPTEGATFWYRTTPKDVCSDGGTTCGSASAGGAAGNCVRDSVFVVTASNTDTTVSVNIGGQGQDFTVKAGVHLVELPFGGRTGDVTVEINGKSGKGPAQISSACPASGRVNFNAVVGATQ